MFIFCQSYLKCLFCSPNIEVSTLTLKSINDNNFWPVITFPHNLTHDFDFVGEGENNFIFIFSLILRKNVSWVFNSPTELFHISPLFHNFVMLFRTFLVTPWHDTDCVVFFLFCFFLSSSLAAGSHTYSGSRWRQNDLDNEPKERDRSEWWGKVRHDIETTTKKTYLKIFLKVCTLYIFFKLVFFSTDVRWPHDIWEDLSVKDCCFYKANFQCSQGGTHLFAFSLWFE